MQLSISTVPLATYMHRKYYDLGATLYVMRLLGREGVVDGFELELLAEWNVGFAPVDRDTKYDRRFEWEASRKYEVSEIVSLIRRHDVPVLSVHANRDIGMLLCSGAAESVDRGRMLMDRAMTLARDVGAGACVFHLWDPWTETVDFDLLAEIVAEQSLGFPEVRAAVENIPVLRRDLTPFAVLGRFPWITLDLKWADMYGELDRFRDQVHRIANVHLHGALMGRRWVLKDSALDFPAVLQTLLYDWGYGGPVTLESEAGYDDLLWAELVAGIRSCLPS